LEISAWFIIRIDGCTWLRRRNALALIKALEKAGVELKGS